MDVRPPLVAHREPPLAGEPGERALHNPPVPPQPLARIHTPPGDARLYPPLAQGLGAAGEVVALVRVQLLRALPRTAARAPDRPDRIHCLLQDLRVVDVGHSEGYGERYAVRSETRWRFEPGLPRSVGFLPTRSPPFWQVRSPSLTTPSTNRSPRPPRGDRASPGAVGATRPLPPSHAGAASRSRAAPATHLLGEHLPGDAALEDEDDAGQRGPVVHTGPATLGLRRLGGKRGLMASHSSSLTSSYPMTPSVASGRGEFLQYALRPHGCKDAYAGTCGSYVKARAAFRLQAT